MDKRTFKENIIEYYDNEAAIRNGRVKKADWKVTVRQQFCDLIKRENKHTLLELGAGTGYDSLFFIDNGFSVKAVDISSEMVKYCREKGVDAYELDFYSLASIGGKYDCIYAMNSLLHVPKPDLPRVLSEIDAVLNDGGFFFMGLYGGEDTESDYFISEISHAPRRFVFHSAEYLKATLPNHFNIVSFETLYIGEADDKRLFHSIIMGKK